VHEASPETPHEVVDRGASEGLGAPHGLVSAVVVGVRPLQSTAIAHMGDEGQDVRDRRLRQAPVVLGVELESGGLAPPPESTVELDPVDGRLPVEKFTEFRLDVDALTQLVGSIVRSDRKPA
jgi:hypothetical protein